MTKKLIIALLTALLLPVAAGAQKNNGRDRQAWMKEMRQFKSEYLARELKLTDDQKARFLPVYNKMEDEERAVADQTFRMSRQVCKKGAEATDLEYEKAAEAIFELKAKEAQIEMKYFPQFKAVLTPAQLLNLKKVENDFSRMIMKQHRDSKGQGQGKPRDRKPATQH